MIPMKQENETKNNESLAEAIRHAAAIILATRYRSRGVPVVKIKKIFSRYSIPYNYGLGVLEEKLKEVGIILKNVRVRHGSKFMNILVPIIDPNLDLPDVSMFDKATTAVLGLIYLKNENGAIELDDLVESLNLIIQDEEEVQNIVYRALNRLKREKLIDFIEGKRIIRLTELGISLSPPRDYLEKIALDVLITGKKDVEKNG